MGTEAATEAERSSSRARIALFCAAALALAPGMLLGPPDAKGMAGALRVLAGEVPYRDFWTMYAPGQFLAQALLFRLFGATYLVQAAAAVAVTAASGVVFHDLLLRVGTTRRTALVLWGVFVLAFWRVAPELTSYPPALFLGLVGLERTLAAHRSEGEDRATRPLVAAGLAFGAAAWFKHDVAAYFAATAALSLVGRRWLAGPGGPRPGRALAALVGGSLAGAGPVIAWLAAFAGADAWHDLIAFPAGDFRLVRAEPYPGPLPALEPFRALLGATATGDDLLRLWRDAGGALRAWSLTQLPVLVLAGAVAALVRARLRGPAPGLAGLWTFALGIPFFFAAAHVQQNTHLDSMALLSLLLIGGGLARARGRLARGVLVVAAALYSGSFLLEAAMRAGDFATSWGSARTLDFPAARGVRIKARMADGYERVVSFVRANVPEDGRFHAGVDRHDAVVGNDQNFYVLADRLPGTRYGELHPAVVDRGDVQREMIADLERHGVDCVVVWYFRFGDPEKRLARRRERIPGIGSDLLDRYVEEQFEEVFSTGRYAVRWRRGAPPPRVP